MTAEACLDRAVRPLERAIAEGRIPGGVLGVVEAGGGRAVRAVGDACIVPERRAMRRQTPFDLASLTKVLFTTPRILALSDAGALDLDAPLTSVLPDLRQYDPDAWERRVTFRQCLGHDTPFPAVAPIYTYGGDAELLRAFVLQREWRPVAPAYSDINFILLGLVLERLAGCGIRDMAAGPGFGWSADPAAAAATEECPWRRRVLCGEVHDENAAALAGAGHAGLFGTADAVLDAALGLLRRTGVSRRAVLLMRSPLGPARTHGWESAHPGWSGGDAAAAATIGHTGFTGTGLWIDFANGRAWTLLTNRIHPGRHAASGIAALRRAVGDAVATLGNPP